MSDLPQGWAEASIGSICSLNNGRAFKPTEWATNGLPIVRIQNLNNPDAPFNHFRGEFESRYYLRGGELLFAWSGTPGTSFGAHVWRGGEAVLNQHIFRVDFDEETLDKRFFRYAINQKLNELIDIAHGGVGLRHVTKGMFERTLVAVPPLNEQKRIADKLDAVLTQVDACRERLDRVHAILKSFHQAVLAAATSGKLTEEWRGENSRDGEWLRVELGTVARDFSYGSAAKSSKSGSVPVLRMVNIQDGLLDWNDLVYTSVAEEITKYRLTAGDVLFNRTNSPELVGKTAVYRGERDAIYAGYLIRVRCRDPLLPDYLNYCLNSPAGRDYCWRVKSDGVSQSNINAKKLAAFEFGLPGIDEQHEIVRRVEALFAYADRLEAHYTAARVQVERLTPALLAKAFRGELVPQDPNDESASMLLERIRAARAASEGAAGPKQRKGSDRPKTSQKSEVFMLTRKDIQDMHLTTILKKRGPLTAEVLWSASQLDIDDFYDQLKDEEARGLLREKRGDSANASRMLEAA